MNVFQSIFVATGSVIAVSDFLLCILVSLIIGAFLSFVYAFRSSYTRSFVLTLAVLPAMVCVVIMMVNGNVGAGVAVAGAFSLVRFRSAAGTARDIGMIFLAMASGLVAGMGYLAYAVLFAGTIGIVWMGLVASGYGTCRKLSRDKTLKLVVPDSVDYDTAFDAVFQEHLSRYERTNVKISGKDSGYKITYDITMKHPESEKALIDGLRKVASGMEVTLTKRESSAAEL